MRQGSLKCHVEIDFYAKPILRSMRPELTVQKGGSP